MNVYQDHTHPGSDARIARIAATQHGLVCIRQLRQLGITGNAIVRRTRDGRLHRVHRGVYAVGYPPATREAMWLAAVLASGDGAALSHIGAATLWGIWRRSAGTGFDIVATRQHYLGIGVRVHRSRTLLPRDVTQRNNIPVTSVARTLLDLADVLDAYQLANVMHEAAFHERLNVRAVRDIIRRNRGRRGVTILSRALDLHVSGSSGTRSSLEDRLLTRLRRAGAETPRVNTRVPAGGGSIEVDAYWPRSGLCMEMDGPGHLRPRSRREDADRDARLRRAGYHVVRLTPAELESLSPHALLTLVNSI